MGNWISGTSGISWQADGLSAEGQSAAPPRGALILLQPAPFFAGADELQQIDEVVGDQRGQQAAGGQEQDAQPGADPGGDDHAEGALRAVHDTEDDGEHDDEDGGRDQDAEAAEQQAAEQHFFQQHGEQHGGGHQQPFAAGARKDVLHDHRGIDPFAEAGNGPVGDQVDDDLGGQAEDDAHGRDL